MRGSAGYTSRERRLQLPHFYMTRFSTARFSRDVFVFCVCGLLAASSTAQVSQKDSGADASPPAQGPQKVWGPAPSPPPQGGVRMGAGGRSQGGFPILKRAAPLLAK